MRYFLDLIQVYGSLVIWYMCVSMGPGTRRDGLGIILMI